jgi:hypothetical protein
MQATAKFPKELQDPEWIEKFCGYIRDGMTISSTAALMRLTKQRVWEWLSLGVEEDSPYHPFLIEVTNADAQLEYELVAHWKVLAAKCGAREVKAVATFLQARFKEQWGEFKQVNISGNVNHQLQRPDLSKLNPIELQQFLENAESNHKLIEAKKDDVIDAEYVEV